MQVLSDLASMGAVPAVAWMIARVVRDFLDYRLAQQVLRRTPDDQLASTLRAINTAQRNRRNQAD